MYNVSNVNYALCSSELLLISFFKAKDLIKQGQVQFREREKVMVALSRVGDVSCLMKIIGKIDLWIAINSFK